MCDFIVFETSRPEWITYPKFDYPGRPGTYVMSAKGKNLIGLRGQFKHATFRNSDRQDYHNLTPRLRASLDLWPLEERDPLCT